MAGQRFNADLNQLLIDLGRSLLQYVGESWPWTSATSHAQDELQALVRRQQAGIARLASLLNERGWTIDFGTYPTEYTDLQYCALSYLLGQLIEGAVSLRGEVDGLLARSSGDPEAAAILERIAADQLHIVEELRRILAAKTSGAAITTTAGSAA